jgi:hypothetical protein
VKEQEVADLFSEHIDCLLRRETPPIPSGGDDLPELVSLAKQLSQVRFQASPAAQAAFQSQLGAWFGPTSEGTRLGLKPKPRRWNMLSGKVFVLILSVVVTVVTAVTAVVIAIVVVVSGAVSGETPAPTAIPTQSPTAVPPISTTVTATSPLTPTVVPTEPLTPTITPPPTLPSTIDTIQTITVVVTVEIRVDDLIPGLPPAGDNGHDDGDAGDHNRGHGNDPDHHDEDNPGCCRH